VLGRAGKFPKPRSVKENSGLPGPFAEFRFFPLPFIPLPNFPMNSIPLTVIPLTPFPPFSPVQCFSGTFLVPRSAFRVGISLRFLSAFVKYLFSLRSLRLFFLLFNFEKSK
jgi:hypothetical protein